MLREIRKDDPRSTDEILRDHLRDALRRAGYGKLVGPHQLTGDGADLGTGFAFLAAAAVGYAAILLRIGAPSWLAVLLALAIGIAIVVSASLEPPESYRSLYLYFGSVLGGAVWQFIAAGFDVVGTHVIPMLAALLVSFLLYRVESTTIKRTLLAVKSVVTDLPLLFPFVALVMFALILNTEIWQAGNSESAVRLAVLGAFVIAPLTWLLRRRLVMSLDDTLAEVAAAVVKRDDIENQVVAQIRTSAGRTAETWVKDNAGPRLTASFDRDGVEESAKRIGRDIAPKVRLRVTIRLVLTVVAVGIAGFLVIYALSWLMVEERVVKTWTGEQHAIDQLAVAAVAVPLGPYLKVAALLAILGTAIFIAFVITNDSLSTEFRNAYIGQPATAAILLAVPYFWIEERARGDDPEPPVAMVA
jgi:hypothetical protein